MADILARRYLRTALAAATLLAALGAMIVAQAPAGAQTPPAIAWSSIASTYTTITFTWTISDNTGVTEYKYLQRKQNDDGTWPNWPGTWTPIPSSGASTTSHTVTGLIPGTAYQYNVRAYAGATEGQILVNEGTSVPRGYQRTTESLAQPIVSAARTIVTATSVTLKWTYPSTNISEITKFQVRYKTNEANAYGAWADVSGGNSARSHQVTGLTSGVEYLFQVRAQAGSHNSRAADYLVTAGQPSTGRATGTDGSGSSSARAPETPLTESCVLEQAGTGGSPAAKSCTKTIPGTGTVSVVYDSGKTGILADDSPSVDGRVVTFTPSSPVAGDDDVGSAVYHIVVSENNVEVARYVLTVTTYAAGQAPSAPAETGPQPNVYKIEFVNDADGVVQPGKDVILKVTRVDGRSMVVGSSVESIEISGLSLAAVRRHYYKDDQRKLDHDGNAGTPAVGDADSDPDVATTVVAFDRRFAVDEVVFRDRGTQNGIPRILGDAFEFGLLFNSVIRYACWSKPKSSNPLATTNGAGTGNWDDCGDDDRYNLGQPFTFTASLEIEVPSGAPSGQYVVTVKGPRTVGGSDMVTETRTLTVGSAPAVGTVSFGLSAPRRAQAGETDKTGDYLNDASMREPATIAAGGGDNNTELTLTVLNANNKPAEANTVSSMVVTTTLGTLAAKAGQTPTCSGGATCAFDLSGLKTSGGALPEKVRVLLTSPAAPGTATVTATVVSGGRVYRPDAVQVRFTGPATTLTVGEAPGTVLGYNVGNDEAADYNAAVKADTGMDARDQLTFALEATDASGAAIKVPTLSAMVKTSGGGMVARSKYETSQSGAMMERLLLDIDAAMASALTPGTYTLELTSGTLKATTTFMVVGASGEVELTLAPETATEIGQGVVASVMVTDAEGNVVADGTMVTFGVSDLVGDDDAVAVLDDTTALTVAGKASTTLTVVGAGRAVVRATVSDDTTPERAVAVLVSTAGGAASVSAEAGLECLSALSGFATWICGVDSTASEVFGLVSPRGASAVHLWNGSAWIRYSVVGGVMVPGSSDFAVGEDDILYISN